jgi:hypothetical protein
VTRTLHTFVHTEPRGSHKGLVDLLSSPLIGRVRVTTPSVLLLCSAAEQSPGLSPSVLHERLYPCRTGLPVDTCNNTPCRSACAPADTVHFPTLSSLQALRDVWTELFCPPTTEYPLLKRGSNKQGRYGIYITGTSTSPNLDMCRYKQKLSLEPQD